MSDNLWSIALEPIKKASVIDQVIEAIKDLMNSGEVSVGDKLPAEMSLSKSLNVGRSTVREAFRVLQAMDYIEIKQGRGAFVKNLNPQSRDELLMWFQTNAPVLSEYMDVRQIIENYAVRMASINRTQEQLALMKELNMAFENAIQSHDVSTLAAIDEDLHALIAKMSGNTLIAKINRLVIKEFRKYRQKTFAVPERAQRALDSHRRIEKAIAEKNVEEAMNEMGSHLERAVEDITNVGS